jgi:hypothetical protein
MTISVLVIRWEPVHIRDEMSSERSEGHTAVQFDKVQKQAALVLSGWTYGGGEETGWAREM